MRTYLSGSARCVVAVVPLLLLQAGCGQNKAADDATATAPEVAHVKSAAEALQGAHVATVDPSTLNGAEVRKVIGARRHCAFRYTSTGHPVVVAGLRPDGSLELGLLKLNNHLVALQPGPAPGAANGGFVLSSDQVRVSVRPLPDASRSEEAGVSRVEANMMFEVGQELKVGYGGFLECRAVAPEGTQRP